MAKARRFRLADMVWQLLALLLLALPAIGQAQDYTYTTNNGMIAIIKYIGSGVDETVPSTINGQSVTSIGDYAFSACLSLNRVTIPTGVTKLGDLVFVACHNLTNAVIPNSVTNLGYSVFNGCDHLTSVTFPTNVPSIGDGMFGGCIRLTSVIIPNSVTNIGDWAFVGCSNLTSIEIPSNVTSVGMQAFSGCSGLTSVLIRSSLTNVGIWAFRNCTSLAVISVDAANPAYSSVAGVLFNKNQSKLIQYPVGSTEAHYSVPNGVSAIQSWAFAECCSLSSLTIPSSVTQIWDDAFADSTNLLRVYFKGNAPSIGTNLFSGDVHATVYYLPGTSGWSTNFAGCQTVLWNPQIQTSVASIGVRANRFGFNVIGSSNLVVVVETSTNLTQSIWAPLQTNTLNGGSGYFSDPQWINYPRRFYRLRPAL